MSPSPQQHVRAASIKSAEPSGNVRNRQGTLLPNANSRSNTTANTDGRQWRTSQAVMPRYTLPNISRQPVPSEASSDGEPDAAEDDIQFAVSLDDDVIHVTHKAEEFNDSNSLITAPEIARCSKAAEMEKHSSLITIEHDQHQSVIPLNESGSTYTTLKDPDLSERVSSCSSIYKSFSSSFSQLHSSLSSFLCESEETFKNSSSVAVTVHDGKSLLAASECASSAPSPGLYSKSCCGNADLYQDSSYSVRKYSQTSDFLPFDKMWHDHFLNHWPVLPPISPQRG
ncbi:uncharacterized protein ACMZJ9_003967 [Mantella aurantiaca]